MLTFRKRKGHRHGHPHTHTHARSHPPALTLTSRPHMHTHPRPPFTQKARGKRIPRVSRTQTFEGCGPFIPMGPSHWHGVVRGSRDRVKGGTTDAHPGASMRPGEAVSLRTPTPSLWDTHRTPGGRRRRMGAGGAVGVVAAPPCGPQMTPHWAGDSGGTPRRRRRPRAPRPRPPRPRPPTDAAAAAPAPSPRPRPTPGGGSAGRGANSSSSESGGKERECKLGHPLKSSGGFPLATV